MNKACFLDRDGVINEEVNYLHEPDKVQLIPGTVEALKLLAANGYKAIVITNQAGVGKGYFPEADIALVHARIQELLAAEGAKIDAFYYCPHHPEYTEKCHCRKPEPGMILQAAADWNIDLAQSCMIGDRPSDIGAGCNAGVKACYLVLTGYGRQVVADNLAAGMTVMETPLAAVKAFLALKK